MKVTTKAIPALCTAFIVACLFGCATQYTAPTSGPTAKVRVMMVSDSYFLMATTYQNGMCKGKGALGIIGAEGSWVRKGYAETSSLNMLGGHGLPDSKRKERLIPAGRPFTVALQALGPATATAQGLSVTSCNFAVTFTPEAAGQYELLHDIQNGTCYLAVNELSRSEDGAVKRARVAGAKQEEQSTCFW